jgi:hypothetical protein
MGTEMAQNGWWHTDEWHRLNWDNAQDEIGGCAAAGRWVPVHSILAPVSSTHSGNSTRVLTHLPMIVLEHRFLQVAVF